MYLKMLHAFAPLLLFREVNTRLYTPDKSDICQG